ncbi:MAG: hypothetical protein KDA87_10170 [Planctomycetales bacterium]|nr:hypothetical protein [Planctomycetales bacterium]
MGMHPTDLENLFYYVGDTQNGVRQLGDPLDVFAGPLASSSGVAELGIGKTDAATGFDFSLNGYQDDVRIYGEILTADQLDVIRLENLGSNLLGDLNANGSLDAADLDALTQAINTNETGSIYDMNGDGNVNAADREAWIVDVRNTYYGDSNLDGEFSSADFVAVFTAGQYEDNVADNSTWATGDWNGDGDFDSSDFVAAFTAGGYELGPKAAVSAVPEPNCLALLGGAIMAMVSLVRRNAKK